MRTRISALLGMVVGLASLAAAGQPAAYAARRVKAPPVIDGKLDDACWTAAAAISPERDKEAADARDKTVVRLCYDDKALYLGADLFHPDPAKLAPRCKERDDEVCVDDSLELFLYPNPEPEAQMVYHWIFNSIPVYYDGQELFTDAGISFSSAWNGYIVAKTSVQKDRWSLEVEIPFGSLGLRPGTRSTWGLGLLANRLGFRDRYQWWPPRSGFTTKGPSALGRLELPGLDFEPFYVSLGDLSLRGCLREAERASLVLSGTALWEASADKAPMEGGLLAQVTTPSGKLLEQKQGFVLKPLATAPFRLLVPATEKGKYGVRCRLADAAGRPLCIREETIETTAEPLRLTLLRPSYRNAIFSKMADKTLRAEAEIDADPGLLADYSLEAKLLPSGREEPLLLRQTFQTLQSNRVLIEKDMKELPDGRYELRATLWRKKGKERVAAASEAIRKLPPSEVEVWFEGRTLHINGRPTFLRVLEGVNPCEYFVRINLEAGFNCFVNWHEPFHKGGHH